MLTNNLERIIIESEEFDEQLIQENGVIPVYTLLDNIMEERNITKSALIRRLNIDRTYGYQLLNGTRTPTRDTLIKICLVLGLNLEDTQRVLKTACKNILYVRNITDAKAIYAIEHNLTYEKAVNFIWTEE